MTGWASERDTPRIQRWRRRFTSWAATVNPNHLVFIDKSGSNTSMTRDRASIERGERVHDKVPRHRGTVTNMIRAMSLKEVTAVMTVEGGTCGEVFTTYVEELLVPTLEPGDFVVLDNLGAHKSPRALAAIRAAGATPIFLPPYSPELNSIERA